MPATVAWSSAIESRKGHEEPSWGHLPWSGQSGGATRLTSRTQSLKQNKCTFARKQERSLRACLPGPGEGSPSEDRSQERLWRRFFQNPGLWWDNRQKKKSSRSPDFRNKESDEVLWLNNFCKPAWVDAQLACLDMEKGCNGGVQDDDHPGHQGGVTTGETVSRLCGQGRVAEAVEALGVLVESDSGVSTSLVYAVLRECVAKKDLVMGRRVHALIVREGYQSDSFLCNHILRMYASHGRLQDAMAVFTEVARPDAFMWSSIISAHVKQGKDKEALELYHRMRMSGVKPDGHVFVAALQACARGGDLETGQELHAHVLAAGVEPDLFVCSSLVDMFAKCGSLEDAHRVFDGLPHKNVVTWTSLIAGYSQQGKGQEALRLYRAMQVEGVAVPNSVTFVCLLQACASVGAPALETGEQLHAQIRERGHEADAFVANSLVNMYAKCGSLGNAQKVFDGLARKDVATWNVMVAGYSQQGMGKEALRVYDAMRQDVTVAPDSVTFVCLLQACAGVGTTALEVGKQLHVQIRDGGLETDVFVANSLVNMYAKCGSLAKARGVFDGLGQKDVVTWNAMIAGYSQQVMGHEALRLYSAMQEEGVVAPDSVTFVCVLQACASVGIPALEMGKQLHARIREQGNQEDILVANSLVNMYAKCGSLEDAQRVFDGLGQKGVATWNAMMAAYSQQGRGQEALRLYSDMQVEGMVTLDSVSFVCLLQACAGLGSPALEMGKQLHAQVKEGGYHGDVFVANSLVNMYAKCGSLEDAQRVFDGLGRKDVVTWTAMMAGYSQQGMGQETLRLYSAMQEEGISVPDSVTFLCLLKACAGLGTSALEKGRYLHAQIRERGYHADAFVANSLVNMYAKCGSLRDAARVFDGLDHKDVATWTAMIAGYSQQGMGQEALRVYRDMQEEGVAVPDSVTFACLLQACANVAALHLGRQLHAQIKGRGLDADALVAKGLINMYGKSGSMADAQQVFDALLERDVVAWNALITGYTCQGDSEAVFDLFQRMKDDGIQPVSITFLSLLTVCSHASLVKEGRKYFEVMRQYGIAPTVEHYTCMVDLLGRAGRLSEVLAFVRTMPVTPTPAVWHTLLGACRKWSNLEVGRHAFNEATKLDKHDPAAYVLMSSIYKSTQMWEEAREMQVRRKRLRAWKQPGKSWWADMDGQVHSFLVGDEKLLMGQAGLDQIPLKLKKESNVSQMDPPRSDTSHDGKEINLSPQSPKQTVTCMDASQRKKNLSVITTANTP